MSDTAYTSPLNLTSRVLEELRVRARVHKGIPIGTCPPMLTCKVLVTASNYLDVIDDD